MTKVFAHRGDARAAPENTVAAFLAAVAAGADGVELDVRRSADGALVVHHDPAIEGLGAIADLLVRDLPPDVALLDDAMDVLEPLTVSVEIKNDPKGPGYDATGSISHQVVARLEERGDLDRVIISSFDLATLDAARQAHPAVALGWLLGYTADPLDAIDVVVAHDVGAVHPFVLTVTQEVVDRAHAAGLDVTTWTVNARHDIERMVTLGVDIVITDDVALGLEVSQDAVTVEMADRATSPLE
ncbi:MAG TPA: glycerophosphodiester phosphodiesterase [Acidimicrobiales bacterium]